MAESPTHKFGQIIGDLLEEVMRVPLLRLATKHSLYLDHKHARPARGNKRKVVWADSKGNEHDLDYVLEDGGTEQEYGNPKAFIESAWRRYTKHSRNKAQEIQGAIVPLAETHRHYNPFLGVVLGGVFTQRSIAQLESHGFTILYFPYESIIAAFRVVGIDAAFAEDTPDKAVKEKVNVYLALGETDKRKIIRALKRRHKDDMTRFLKALERTINRVVQTIFVVPLHGQRHTLSCVEAAVAFIRSYDESPPQSGFVKYEIVIRYSTGDKINASFQDKTGAIEFLRKFG